jgi:hypothetical protein
MDTSEAGAAAGGMDDRGTRTVVAFGVDDTADGIGVGLRKPGTGVGLRITDDGCDVARFSVLDGGPSTYASTAMPKVAGALCDFLAAESWICVKTTASLTEAAASFDSPTATVIFVKMLAARTNERVLLRPPLCRAFPHHVAPQPVFVSTSAETNPETNFAAETLLAVFSPLSRCRR